MDVCFLGSQESCAAPHADGPKTQRGSRASPVHDAPTGHHGQRRNRIDHLWHQSHGPEIAADVAACLASLSDNQIEARVSGAFGLINGAYDLYGDGIGCLYATEMGAPVAPEKRYGAHTMVQGDPEPFVDRKIQHEVGAERPFGQRLHGGKHLPKLFGIAPGTSQMPQASRLRDSGG